VVNGPDVVDAIAATPTERGTDGAMSKPVTPAVIEKITVRK